MKSFFDTSLSNQLCNKLDLFFVIPINFKIDHRNAPFTSSSKYLFTHTKNDPIPNFWYFLALDFTWCHKFLFAETLSLKRSSEIKKLENIILINFKEVNF